MKHIFLTLIAFLQITDAFALNEFNPACFDGGLSLPPKIEKMQASSQVLACLATKEAYKCDELKNDLEDKDKHKVIQCDDKSLAANSLGEMSLSDCVWNGLKITGTQLLNLKALPGKIAEGIAEGFKKNQFCDASIEKKREILNAFNLTIEDPRFKLNEQFLGRWLEDANCGEIERLVSARYRNYTDTIMRENKAAIDTGKKVKHVIKDSNPEANFNLVEFIKKAMQEAEVTYQCYTPKVKAEMICTTVTSYLSKAALGGGMMAAVKGISLVVKSKRALARIDKAVKAGEKADLSDAGALLKSDRLKAAEKILGRTITDEEKKAIIAAHNIAKDKGFGEYSAEDIARKARELKKPKTIEVDERRALMENGITGVEHKLKHGHPVRVKSEGMIGDAFERGAKEKIAEGIKEGKKFYKELIDLNDKDFAEAFSPREGLFLIKRGNEYGGLSVRESADALTRMIKTHGMDEAGSLQTAISSMSHSLKEYAQMQAKKFSPQMDYKIYRTKELKAELMERYFTRKYTDKYNDLDFDRMDPREQELFQKIRQELAAARKEAEKKGWTRD